jgi:hypothetical protein
MAPLNHGAQTMTKTLADAIAELVSTIAAEEAGTLEKKRTVNVLCGVDGRAPIYKLDKPERVKKETGLTFAPDAFYGEPLASSARRVLEASKASGGGAMSLDALFAALKAGGFAFDAKSDAFARRSLAISLSKNTAAFVRLPSGDYGLKGWYKRVVRLRAPTTPGGRELADPVEVEDFEDLTDGPDSPDSVAGLLSPPATESLDVAEGQDE